MGSVLSTLWDTDTKSADAREDKASKKGESNIYPVTMAGLYGGRDKIPSTESGSEFAELLHLNLHENNYMIDGLNVAKSVCYYVAASILEDSGLVDVEKLGTSPAGCMRCDIDMMQGFHVMSNDGMPPKRLNKSDIKSYMRDDVVIYSDGKTYLLEKGDLKSNYAFVNGYCTSAVTFTLSPKSKSQSKSKSVVKLAIASMFGCDGTYANVRDNDNSVAMMKNLGSCDVVKVNYGLYTVQGSTNRVKLLRDGRVEYGVVSIKHVMCQNGITAENDGLIFLKKENMKYKDFEYLDLSAPTVEEIKSLKDNRVVSSVVVDDNGKKISKRFKLQVGGFSNARLWHKFGVCQEYDLAFSKAFGICGESGCGASSIYDKSGKYLGVYYGTLTFSRETCDEITYSLDCWYPRCNTQICAALGGDATIIGPAMQDKFMFLSRY